MKTEIETKETAKTTELVQEIAIERVVADPEQPRKVFDLGALQGLAESIQENGIVQPLIARAGDWFIEAGRHGKEEGWFVLNREWIRPKGAYIGPDMFYKTDAEAKGVLANARPVVLVAGERRWRAAKLAGLKSVPCIVRSYPDGAMGEKKVFGVQMVENLQRENLSALEEAAALAKQIEKGRKAEELAKELGISRATVFAKLRLNSLSEPVKTELLRGNITASVAGLIAMTPAEVQTKFLKEVTGNHGFEGVMSYRRAEELLERNYARALPGRGNDKTAFDTTAEYKWEKGMMGDMKKGVAPACEICPRRSGNMEGSGLKNANVCTEPRCFEAKTKAAGALKAELARKQGRTVLEGKEGAKLFSEYGDEEVQHGSGFVELDKRADVLGWDEKKTYRQVLEKAPEVKVVVAIDREGRARELVAREEAVKVLKECGKIKPEKASASDAKWERERKQEQEAEKIRVAECNAVVAAIVAKVESLSDGGPGWLWKLVAEAMVARFGFYNTEPLRRRRKWEKGDHRGFEEMLGMKGMEHAGIAAELAAFYSEDVMNAMCEALKIDQKKLAKEVREAKGKKPKTKQEKAEVLPARGKSKQKATKGAKKKGKSRK